MPHVGNQLLLAFRQIDGCIFNVQSLSILTSFSLCHCLGTAFMCGSLFLRIFYVWEFFFFVSLKGFRLHFLQFLLCEWHTDYMWEANTKVCHGELYSLFAHLDGRELCVWWILQVWCVCVYEWIWCVVSLYQHIWLHYSEGVKSGRRVNRVSQHTREECRCGFDYSKMGFIWASK